MKRLNNELNAENEQIISPILDKSVPDLPALVRLVVRNIVARMR